MSLSDKNNCSRNIIGAHALQNKRILSKLSKDNHVIIMNYKNKPLFINVDHERLSLNLFSKVGVNDATKYPCFCKKHDDEVFADIEKDGCDFTKGNKKQEFLYAYKAFIFEYYKQKINYKQFQQLAKDMLSKLKEVSIIRYYRELTSKELDVNYYKIKFDEALLSCNYNTIETVIVELPSVINFANFSCISPRYNLHGKRNKLFNRKDKVHRKLFITIFPDNMKSYILVSYLKSDYKYFKSFVDQIKSEDKNLIMFYFNSTIPIYSDNIVLNPNLWNSWAEEIQIAFNYLNNLNGHEWIMDKAISFGLKNNRKYKDKAIGYRSSKINMFG